MPWLRQRQRASGVLWRSVDIHTPCHVGAVLRITPERDRIVDARLRGRVKWVVFDPPGLVIRVVWHLVRIYECLMRRRSRECG
jgi:hypothetical protein